MSVSTSSLRVLCLPLGATRVLKSTHFRSCLSLRHHYACTAHSLDQCYKSSPEYTILGHVCLYVTTARALLTPWTSSTRVAYCLTQQMMPFFPKTNKQTKTKTTPVRIDQCFQTSCKTKKSLYPSLPSTDFVLTNKSSGKKAGTISG